MPVRSANPLIKQPNAEPIPGYRLIEPLGKGGFGEVWKCEAPGGLFKAIKFVHGNDNELHNTEVSGADQELRALQHVKSIRHPFLLSMDRVEHVGGELIIVMELADRSLHDLVVEYRAAGANGIPRSDLLLFLREAAEVLDLMNQEYGLQHLDIKPRNLFLVHQHVKVADFGLVNSLAELNGHGQTKLQLAAFTPLYAAPETFLNKITLFTDQYSLAVVYCELLTGQLPFNGKNFRQLALQHTSGKPDLSALAPGDQQVVAKALAKDPRSRYSSCLEFIRTLSAVPEEDLVRPAADTRSENRALAVATMFDLEPVEKKNPTASIARPTKSIRSDSVVRSLRAATDDPDGAINIDELYFVDCLGRTPLGELWRVETPEGESLFVKLVNTFNPGMGEETAAAQLRAIRHRGLFPCRIVPHTSNRLALVSAPFRETLASRAQECQHRGQQGIPRLELLGYLLKTAQTLDELQRQYGLQHLGLSPRTLLLIDGELKISDFGLMALVWLPGGQLPAQINPRYSPPELFQRRLSKHCDQYSLALLFYELLTGDQVHGSRTPSQMARARSTALESLDLLPAPDRPILARALNPEPEGRYPSCTDFIRALIENTPGAECLLDEGWTEIGSDKQDILQPVQLSEPPSMRIDRELAGRVVQGIVTELTGNRQLREIRGVPYYYTPGEEIDHRCYARVVPGTLRLKLTGFVEQWKAQLVREEEERFLFHFRLQTSLWRRMMGTPPVLELDLRARPPHAPGATLTEVRLLLRPVGCSGEEGASSLETWGPRLIESLRTHLAVGAERRKHFRLPFERAILARPVFAPGKVGDEIQCQCKDISLEGIGLYLPIKPPPQLLLRLSRSEKEATVQVPAQVVRSQPATEGRFEVGLRFSLS